MNPNLPTQIASIDLICFLYHTFQTSVSYKKNIQDPCLLPPDSIHFRNDQRCPRQSKSSNFPIPRCKNKQSRKKYFNRVVYSWNKLPESVKNASTLLGFKNSLIIYFNDILESSFNVNDTCTCVHVCKCAL